MKTPFGKAKKTNFKNNSKPAATKAPRSAVPKVPAEWLYMTDREIKAEDILAAIDTQMFSDVEIWHEAGILEVTLEEKSSMDIEAVEAQMDDDYSNAFLQENGVKSLFMVTIRPESFEKAKILMFQITGSCGGFFCGDTEEFQPRVSVVPEA